MASYETLGYEERDHVAWITLDRPEVHNAFDRTMQHELGSVWRQLRHNDDVHVAVLTGAGDTAFCVGIDRREPFSAADASAERGGVFGTSNPFMYDDPGADLGPKQAGLWKPVIAAVNGMACGGAFYMLSEVDVIIAADHATFFDPHVTYGMAAVYEPMQMLQRMPLGEVLRMSLAGNHERMTATTAERIGLVSEVVPAAELHDAAARFASIVASQPPLAVQTTLRAIWAANDLSRDQALSMAPALLANGMDPDEIAAGSERFSSGERIEPRLR